MRIIGIAAAAAAFALCAAPASATIVLTAGNNPFPGEENITLTSGPLDATVTGLTLTTNTGVVFTGDEDIVAVGTSGITGDDGNLTSLAISLADSSLGFGGLIGNLFTVESGQVNVVGHDQSGTEFSFPDLTLGIGNNFFTFTTADNELITDVSFTSTIQVGQVNTLRIGAFASLPATVVPEPTIWSLMLLGFAGLGQALRARSRFWLPAPHPR